MARKVFFSSLLFCCCLIQDKHPGSASLDVRKKNSIGGTCLEIDIHWAGSAGEPGYSPGQHNLQRHHGYRQHRQLVLVTQQTILNKLRKIEACSSVSDPYSFYIDPASGSNPDPGF
jgi:hypothetical protein